MLVSGVCMERSVHTRACVCKNTEMHQATCQMSPGSSIIQAVFSQLIPICADILLIIQQPLAPVSAGLGTCLPQVQIQPCYLHSRLRRARRDALVSGEAAPAVCTGAFALVRSSGAGRLSHNSPQFSCVHAKPMCRQTNPGHAFVWLGQCRDLEEKPSRCSPHLQALPRLMAWPVCMRAQGPGTSVADGHSQGRSPLQTRATFA